MGRLSADADCQLPILIIGKLADNRPIIGAPLNMTGGRSFSPESHHHLRQFLYRRRCRRL